jgi:hypothetical protein
MHLIRGSMPAMIVRSTKGKGRIRNHDGPKTQVPRDARRCLDGIVRNDSYDDDGTDRAAPQPAFKIRTDKGARCGLRDDQFAILRGGNLFEFDANLVRTKGGSGLSGYIADMDDRTFAPAPVR